MSPQAETCDIGRMVEGGERAAAAPSPPSRSPVVEQMIDLVHVAIDGQQPALRIDRQQMRIRDHVAAPAADIIALGRQLDDARIGRMHQRVLPQHDEDMARAHRP